MNESIAILSLYRFPIPSRIIQLLELQLIGDCHGSVPTPHNDSYELAHVQFVGDYSEEMEQSADVRMRAGLKKMRAGGGVNGYLGFSANQKSR
ncbi:hypothetical protein [Ancylomarina longa]|uniref:Uncharacterized protein n=1 Tax=Ancylomarina longa TaxID=2487017 RepID=A0A434AEN3_9BACT|nr:hypothetical protein [Ancylomarina longa]RUT72798.1 hypothetical protein DLK05_16700 [Ancylomarina longa]